MQNMSAVDAELQKRKYYRTRDRGDNKVLSKVPMIGIKITKNKK